jgi:hypothetical protein
LGLLPLDRAYVVWVSLSVVLLGVSLFLIMFLDWQPASKHYVLPLVAGLVVFRPAWVTLRNGQVSALLLFVLCLVILCWEERRWRLGGLWLALLGLRPTLGLPLLGLVSVWLIARRHWQALGGLALGGVLLLLVAQLQNPRWVAAVLDIGSTKLGETFGYSPTLWGLAGLLCGHVRGCTVMVGGGLVTALFVGAGVFLVNSGPALRPVQLFCLCIPLALVAMPYGWAYDQVLLIMPLAHVTMQLARRGGRYLGTALIFFSVDVLAILLLVVAIARDEDTLSALVPLLVFGLVAWVWRLTARPAASPLGLAARA